MKHGALFERERDLNESLREHCGSVGSPAERDDERTAGAYAESQGNRASRGHGGARLASALPARIRARALAVGHGPADRRPDRQRLRILSGPNEAAQELHPEGLFGKLPFERHRRKARWDFVWRGSFAVADAV